MKKDSGKRVAQFYAAEIVSFLTDLYALSVLILHALQQEKIHERKEETSFVALIENDKEGIQKSFQASFIAYLYASEVLTKQEWVLRKVQEDWDESIDYKKVFYEG